MTVEDPSGRLAAKARRRRFMMLTAAVIGLAMLLPGLATVMQRDSTPAADQATSTTPAAPAIKPLAVVVVTEVVGVGPDGCPAPGLGPYTEHRQLCDLEKKGLYTLGSDRIELQLTGASAVPPSLAEALNPTAPPTTTAAASGGYTVHVLMTPESGREFADFTAAHPGKQLAFVRDSQVVSAPKVDGRIEGQTLVLSGELTAEQAERTAALLRNGS
ncbi:SecDF P1 head subdomain-containing protein [Mycolicibacterium insubricum]|jgi:hypothetical protein|uniref:SecDF P1 head subdomain domain-containing protein n=1 Tax=Mycolicibacterium insubricum TaxID=444597 RepID=A0A1X0CUY4_9MYCO|nr:hypothetical protein [Mycolicibacterium insubricum]MCV7083875.1 hypothetical protein [Mycolicibacterium insubricum]ORA63270.1 hypothetical protein BST26_20485 [Mycolicibacterium insubricum]